MQDGRRAFAQAEDGAIELWVGRAGVGKDDCGAALRDVLPIVGGGDGHVRFAGDRRGGLVGREGSGHGGGELSGDGADGQRSSEL